MRKLNTHEIALLTDFAMNIKLVNYLVVTIIDNMGNLKPKIKDIPVFDIDTDELLLQFNRCKTATNKLSEFIYQIEKVKTDLGFKD